MSCRVGQGENLSPKAAAFSIENLLGNSSTVQNSAEGDHKISTSSDLLRGSSYNTNDERRTASKIKVPRPIHSLNDTNYLVQNFTERTPTNAIQGKDCHNTKTTPSIPSSLQQFAVCCDLVRGVNDMDERPSLKMQSAVSNTRQEIRVALQHSDLWWKFYACGTEMVITRTGR